jgi:DUF4097 and DUF4098 domain-containing protein YvlB
MGAGQLGDMTTTALSNSAAIRDIEIKSSAANIVVISTANGEPRMVVRGDIEPTVSHANGILSIDTRTRERDTNVVLFSWHFGLALQREITLYLPKSDFHRVALSSTSGNVRVEGVNAETLTANATSGNIRVMDTAAANLVTQSTSGRLELTDTHTQVGTLRSTSGNIAINNGSVHSITANATSGNITIDAGLSAGGYANLRAGSGNIRLTGSLAAGQRGQNVAYTTQTTSGTARVNGTRLEGRSNSQHFANPAFSIDAHTTSGNIRIDIN